MHFSKALLVAVVALIQPALATVVITSPVASTSVTGGQKLDIEWNDDGNAPLVTGSAWGRIDIFLATGSVNTQYKLAQLASNLSPSTTSYSATIPKNAGPSGKQYFLRFEGSRTDNKTGYPVMAFSARFQLNGMTGQFNSSESAANQGATDPITGASSAASTGMTTSRATTTAASFSTANAAASASSTTKSSPAGRNAPLDAALTLSGAVALGALALL